jgi:hypothetical protein
MEITCPCCNKKFEPLFMEDGYEVHDYKNSRMLSVEDPSCTCPHCHAPIRLSVLSEYDQFQVEADELRKNNSDGYEEDEQEASEEE